MSEAEHFQVDLGGLVDLLSTHLYSGPSVYVRELVQNASDAITARSAADPDAPRRVTLGFGDGAMTVTDTGIGLQAEEARRLLSTIASSAKRDDLFGGGRREFIGQFGIGLLSAFTVGDEVRVTSRSACEGAAPVRWIGRADGTFTLEEIAEEIHVGTRVEVIARPGSEHWVDAETVIALTRDYAGLLALDVGVEVDVPGVGVRRRRLTEPELPWQRDHSSAHARAQALAEYCRERFGFTPLAHIDLAAEAVGLTGVAFVLPAAVAPGAGHSRVYLKRMLLGAKVAGLLPEWAFFVRAVVDADGLSPAASREQLRDDAVAEATRDVLGRQVIAWVLAHAADGSALARRLVETHHLALRSLATTNDDVLDLVARVVPFETTGGLMTLADVAHGGPVAYTTSTESFRAVAAVARAQGLVVVNAGYVYDADLLARLDRLPGFTTREFDAADLTGSMALPSPEREAASAQCVVEARELLENQDCDVILRAFEPATCPAVLLRDADGERRRELEAERAAADDLWGGLLDALAQDEVSHRSRTLALNDASPVVRALLATHRVGRPELFESGLRAVYSTAVLLSGEPLRAAETAELNTALTVLLTNGLSADDSA